jgi:hypothetical protein
VGTKAAFGRGYPKAAPNFQKSQFMENSRLRSIRGNALSKGNAGKR